MRERASQPGTSPCRPANVMAPLTPSSAASCSSSPRSGPSPTIAAVTLPAGLEQCDHANEQVDLLDRHEPGDQDQVELRRAAPAREQRAVDAARHHLERAGDAALAQEADRARAHRDHQIEIANRVEQLALDDRVRSPQPREVRILAPHAAIDQLGGAAHREVPGLRAGHAREQSGHQAVDQQVKPAHHVGPRPQADDEEGQQPRRH